MGRMVRVWVRTKMWMVGNGFGGDERRAGGKS